MNVLSRSLHSIALCSPSGICASRPLFSALAGIGVATYIAIAESGGGAPKCLAGGSGCGPSRPAEPPFGVNVAVIGMIGYLLCSWRPIVPGDPGGRSGASLAALIGFGFSLYLTYLGLYVIDAICQWCVASAVLMAISLAVAATRAFAYAGHETGGPQLQSSHGR